MRNSAGIGIGTRAWWSTGRLTTPASVSGSVRASPRKACSARRRCNLRARKLQRRLAEQALRGEALTEPDTEAGVVNRPVDHQARVPIPIPAEFLIQRLVPVDPRYPAAAHRLAAIKI